MDRRNERTELEKVCFPLERGKLAELARAYHEQDPVWRDPAAAADAGLARVPVPPTATVLLDHWREGGALADALALGLDVGRLLHGEVAWEYVRPLEPGEELTATVCIVGVTRRAGRRGGEMTFVTREVNFAGADGQLAVRRRDTLIETGAQA